LRGGGAVSIRPIRPEDEPKMVRFHGTLSENSVFMHYAGFIPWTRSSLTSGSRASASSTTTAR
jgi:hypothetical protein